MSNRIRRGLFAAAGLIGGLAAQPARASGDIEKPPEVPPEVCAAKTACPTLTGPCFGYYPAPGMAGVQPERPSAIPSAYRQRAAATPKPPVPNTISDRTTRESAKADPAPTRATAARVVVIPPPPQPEPPVPTADVEPNRPMLAAVLPDSSKLRK
jgi:hypothetical protein